FLKLWRQEKEGNLRDEAIGYMHVASQTVATDAERWRKLHAAERETDRDLELLPADAAQLDEQLHWRNAMAFFVSSVKQLAAAQRQIFVLHYLKGMHYPEISARLGISERSIERYMAQALEKLHDRLKDYL